MDEFLDLLAEDATLSIGMMQYFHQLKDKRTIIFNEEITADVFEQIAVPLLEMDNDGSGEPITILFTSVGGSAFDGLYLCNIIDNLKTPTTIIFMGYAYSMGFYIACAGKDNPNVTKKCYPFTTFMMHKGSLNLSTTANQAKDYMVFDDKIQDSIKNFVLSHSAITEEYYEAHSRDDAWFTAEDALAMGVVDEIIGN